MVPPLPLADDGQGPAVQLFLERARAVAPGFAPDAAERALIAEIVRRLDGLPLAIELAAARLHTHDVAEVAAGLDQRFALLSSGYRTATRHGSLGRRRGVVVRAARRRPAADLRRPLRVRRAVRRGRRGGRLRHRSERRSTTALAQLVERSLVTRAPGRRYVLLETLRAFGAEQLAEDGRLDAVAERHARHFSRRGSSGATAADGTPGEPVLAEIDAAVPELRDALGWLLDHGDVDAGRPARRPRCCDYGFLRLRPDVLAWAERVDRRPIPTTAARSRAAGVGGRRLRGVDGRRRGRRPGVRSASGRAAERSPAAIRPPW